MNVFSWFIDTVIKSRCFLGLWDKEIWYKTIFFHFINLTWPPQPQKEKFAWGVKAKLWKQKNCWHHSAIFAFTPHVNFPAHNLNFSLKVMGLNRGYLLTSFVLYIGNISVPGTIGATVVEEPVSVDDGFDPNSPLVYNFGHKSPGFNLPLMNLYVTQMADTIR